MSDNELKQGNSSLTKKQLLELVEELEAKNAELVAKDKETQEDLSTVKEGISYIVRDVVGIPPGKKPKKAEIILKISGALSKFMPALMAGDSAAMDPRMKGLLAVASKYY